MKTKILIFSMLTICFLSSSAFSQDVIVIDGLGGVRGRFMQGEVDRLQQQGLDVVYRPWWRWRSAARSAPQASRVIGYSMGGPRAIQIAKMVGANQLELLDPVSIRSMHAPDGTVTAVYRASMPDRIHSTPVFGQSYEYWFPTNHPGMAVQFPSFPRPW